MKDELQLKDQIIEALKTTEQKYVELFNNANEGIFLHELAEDGRPGKFVEVNDSACRMTGYSREELLALTPLDIDETPPDTVRKIVQELRSKGRVLFETIMITKDRDRIPIEISNHIFLLNGRITVSSIVRDISKRRQAETELRRNEAKYRSLVESTEDSIYIVDKNCTYLFMNSNHASRIGFSGDGYLGRTYREFHSPEETKWFKENIDKVFRTGHFVKDEHKSLRDNRYFLLTFSPIRDANGEIQTVSIVSKNISYLKQIEEDLRYLSFTDELTGLYNRRGFNVLAEQQLKMANRLNQGVCMLFGDVDGLKTINDVYGHTEGDRALIDIADILRSTYRDSDIIARIGGDEFAVFPIVINGDNFEVIIDRLQKALADHNNKTDRKYTLSLSVGVESCGPQCPYKLDELIMKADRQMYMEKRKKKSS